MPEEIQWDLVEDRIPELVARVNSTARFAVAKVAHSIAAEARELVPIDTGLLHDSIRVQSVAAGYEATVTAGDDSEDGAYYAGYVEFGTRFMAAQPFLYPAIADHRLDLIPEVMIGFEI